MDLIDRQAAIDAVRSIVDDTPDSELSLEDVAFRDGVQYAISILCNLPSIQPRKGRQMNYMTPAEFEDKIQIIFRDYGNDPEMFHRKADELMCETLKGLGYETGVKVFEKQKKRYAGKYRVI